MRSVFELAFDSGSREWTSTMCSAMTIAGLYEKSQHSGLILDVDRYCSSDRWQEIERSASWKLR
jgi:hypothetical protein